MILRDQLNLSEETTVQWIWEIFVQEVSLILKHQSRIIVIDLCILEIWLAKKIMTWKVVKNLMMRSIEFKKKFNNLKSKKSVLTLISSLSIIPTLNPLLTFSWTIQEMKSIRAIILKEKFLTSIVEILKIKLL